MVQTEEESSKVLWCGNLHEKVTEELLYELFIQAGPLEKVKIVTPASGARYAFVTFKHSSSVPYTLNLMNGIRLFDRALRLQMRTSNSTPSSTSSCPSTPVISVQPNLIIPSPCPAPSPTMFTPMIRYPLPQFSSSPLPVPVGFSNPNIGPALFGVRPVVPNVGFHRSYSFPDAKPGDERMGRRTDTPSGEHKSAAPYARHPSSSHHDSYRGADEHAVGRHDSGQRSYHHRDRYQQQHSNQDYRHSNRSSNSRRYQ